MGDFQPQELAITAWAFATVRHLDAWLFVALARVAEQHLGGFNTQGLGNTAWAFENMRSIAATATLKIKHPFPADRQWHSETSLPAYQDVAPFLDLVASQLGKNRSTLSIFDPYFCAGTMKKHLGSLGFHTVYNECEDFYSLICEGFVPPHDVLVTAPPYAKANMQRLFFFCNANAKPYFVRLPADGHKEKYFLQSLILLTTETMTRFDGTCTSDGASDAHQGWQTQGPVYLCPRRSTQQFWTPKGFPCWEETDSHMLELGHEGFFCVWCIGLEAACARHEFIEIARLLLQRCGTQDAAAPRVHLCTSSKNI